MDQPGSSSNLNEKEKPISVSTIKIPENNDFDQETARYLLDKCSALIVENFPVGSEFGIDLSIHYTGKNFLGLKMIPPGLHFIHFRLVDKKTNSVAPRIGFFHCFQSGECLITRWDSKEEDIILDRGAEEYEQMERLRENFYKGQLDNRLGAYQFDTYQTWFSLTDYISPRLLQRMNPLCKKIYSASNLVYKPNHDGSSSTNRLDGQGLPDMVVSPESAVRFISSPPKHFIYPEGSSPEQITRNSIDSSHTLKHLIQHYHGGNQYDLLGEFQFAFITFLLGHQYEPFEFWCKLLRIICSAGSALRGKKKFHLEFVRVIHFQLEQTNEAMFADIVANDNQVYRFMRTFFLNLQNLKYVSNELRESGQKFYDFLQKKFRWHFDLTDQDPDDERPIVVHFHPVLIPLARQ